MAYNQILHNLPSSAFYQKLNESSDELMKRLQVDAKWMSNQYSNFEYLMLLNVIAGRSLQDITQYPIFPWVLNNYESVTYDIKYSFFAVFPVVIVVTIVI